MRHRIYLYPLLIALYLTPIQSVAQTTTWNVGDVFIADGSSYQVWRNGALLEMFSGAWGQAGGCAFDAQFNLYGTYGMSWKSGEVIEFSGAAHSAGSPVVVGSPLNTGVFSESIVFDASGHFYVGSPNNSVLQYTPTLPPASSGAISYQKTAQISTIGEADQIDLGTDQSDLFFGSSSAFPNIFSKNIDRIDLTNSSNGSTAATTPDTAWSVRLLPPADINPNTVAGLSHPPIHGMLIADNSSVLQLNSAGEVVATFQPSGKCKSLRYLALDPDGASFWVADVGDSKVYRINLATGDTMATISLSGIGTLGGVCVLGGQQLNIVPLQFPSNGTNVTRVAPFGDPQIDSTTLQPAVDATGQTLSPDYHTWSATIDSVATGLSLVVSATGQGPQPSASTIEPGTPFLNRFDEYFCGQAEPAASCTFPASGPTLVPIPYTDQVLGNFDVPTVSGSGTHLSPGNRVVYRVANPPATGNIVATIGYLQPPVCPVNGTLISPVLTGTSNAANCYIPAACPSTTTNYYVNSPRFMLDPSEPPPADAALNHQFAFDTSIGYYRDTKISGGGGRSDHAVADRCPSSNGSNCIATAVFEPPLPKSKAKIGSTIPVKVSVTDCDGNAVKGANVAPNAMTITVTGPQGQIEAATAQSFPFFSQKGGAGGTYSGNLVTCGFAPGLTTICVASTNSGSTGTGAGQFLPVCATVNMLQ